VSNFQKKIHALILAHNVHRYNKFVDQEKRALFSDLTGQVLEIGAGTGINIQYIPKDTHYTCLEPNTYMKKYLEAEIYKRGLIDARIISELAESLPFKDNSFDFVIGTLVLCTVKDPYLVLSEIARVLKPDGRFLFIEHVAAHSNTRLRKMQHYFKKLWGFFADGCNPERETAEIIRASNFINIQIKEFNLPIRSLVSPHIIGTATVNKSGNDSSSLTSSQ
jgi:ubiquinone/menaquinone biosynthesis C-methylase UbiE